MEHARKRAGKQPRIAGQAMTEFIITFGLGFFMILGIIQMALVYNAHSMLKLAAFNAARAVIVSRPDKIETAAKLDDMRADAQLEAWFTILPVIPWIQGRMSGGGALGLGKNLQLFHDVVKTAPSNAIARRGAIQAGLNVLGGNFAARAARIASEFSELKVTFYQADKQLTQANLLTDDFAPTPQQFDDRTKARENLVRVVVRWDFPLLIPFVDRVIFVASGQGSTAGNKPAWAVGTHLYQGRTEPFRIPLFASYVMRMQWDVGS